MEFCPGIVFEQTYRNWEKYCLSWSYHTQKKIKQDVDDIHFIESMQQKDEAFKKNDYSLFTASFFFHLRLNFGTQILLSFCFVC